MLALQILRCVRVIYRKRVGHLWPVARLHQVLRTLRLSFTDNSAGTQYPLRKVFLTATKDTRYQRDQKENQRVIQHDGTSFPSRDDPVTTRPLKRLMDSLLNGDARRF